MIDLKTNPQIPAAPPPPAPTAVKYFYLAIPVTLQVGNICKDGIPGEGVLYYDATSSEGGEWCSFREHMDFMRG